jgi:hypothetical protein
MLYSAVNSTKKEEHIMTEAKVSSEVTIRYNVSGDEYNSIIHGAVTIKEKYSRTKDVTEFVWNTGCDVYPVLKNKPWNKAYVQQLATMIRYYMRITV